MPSRYAVGLFQSKGIAEDACNRMKTAGIPEADISLSVLREIGPVPATMSPELEALQVDPMILGNARETFARFIHNGETAVFVRAASEAELRAAIDTLWQYAPVAVETFEAPERAR
jgi:hypothetical protein